MAMTYATITGRITQPGSDIGVRARITATPMTTDAALKFPDEDRITWGPQVAETDAAGNLSALKIPLNSSIPELYWRLTAEALDRGAGPKKWTLGTFLITTPTSVNLADLVEVETLAVNPQTLVTLTELVDSATTSATSAAASATSAAASASVAQSIVIADADTVVATLVTDKTSDTGKALVARFVPTFTPEVYGAVGDGIADDTAAVQAAFNAAGNATGLTRAAWVVLSQSYRITRNLYGFGATTFEGPGELVIDGDLDAADGAAYWWNLGVKSKGGARSTWTGRMSVNIRATANARVGRVVNLHLAADFAITRCRFDLTALQAGSLIYPGGGIAGYNNAAWCTDPSRDRGWISENTLLARQSSAVGSEGIGLGPATHLWVVDNYVHGFGDDAIAMHKVDHFTVRGNRCFTPDGRILVQSGRWGTVTHNHVERIANPDGSYAEGGGLLYLDLYDETDAPVCTSVKVADNYLHLPAGVTANTYMLRVRGARDCSITGNELHSDSPDTGIQAVSIEAQNYPGWTDPTGIDPPGVARVSNLLVSGNRSTGSKPRGLSEIGAGIPGYVTYSDNLFSQYAITSVGSLFQPSNRVIGGNPDSLAGVDGGLVTNAQLLFEGDLTVTNSAVNKVKRNGVDRWYPRRKCIITSVEVETAAPLTAGYFVVQLKKNGGAAAGSDDVGVDGANPRGRRNNYLNATNNRATAATDYFELVAQGAGLAPDPTQCRVRVFGLFTDLG